MSWKPRPETHDLEEAFHDFAARLNLKYFRTSELLENVGETHKRALNEFPPPQFWPNAAMIFRFADVLRETCGYPLGVTSAWRAPEYNQAVGGVERSQHQEFRAVDLVPYPRQRKRKVDGQYRWVTERLSVEQLGEIVKTLRGERILVPIREIQPHTEGRAPFYRDRLNIEKTKHGTLFEYQGGLGIYPEKRFIHIDCRGMNHTW